MLQLGKSQKAFDDAKRYLPGGVNSPVRSYRSVGSTPPFISSPVLVRDWAFYFVFLQL